MLLQSRLYTDRNETVVEKWWIPSLKYEFDCANPRLSTDSTLLRVLGWKGVLPTMWKFSAAEWLLTHPNFQTYQESWGGCHGFMVSHDMPHRPPWIEASCAAYKQNIYICVCTNSMVNTYFQWLVVAESKCKIYCTTASLPPAAVWSSCIISRSGVVLIGHCFLIGKDSWANHKFEGSSVNLSSCDRVMKTATKRTTIVDDIYCSKS